MEPKKGEEMSERQADRNILTDENGLTPISLSYILFHVVIT